MQGMQQMLAAQALKQTPEGDRALDSSVVVQRNVHKMIEVGSPVRSVAVQPKGTVFASGEKNGAVRLWDANTGEPVRDLLAGNGGNGGDEKAVNAVAFSPDGQGLASASEDGSVRWWNAGTGELVGKVLNGHDGMPVNAVAFSPDGRDRLGRRR